MYPPMARLLHTSGEVKAAFVVDANGSVISIEILAGDKLLAQETEQNIRTWKFRKHGGPSREAQKDHSTFVYSLREDSPDTLAVRMRSYRHVEIEAQPGAIY